MKKFLLFLFIIIISTTRANAEITTYSNISFWKKFNDENLINNLNNIYQNNHDLKSAVLKVKESKRIVKMAFADELPHIGFKGYIGQIFHSSDEIFGDIKIPDYTEAHFLLPLNMNYEIDIWGKNHLKTKSKKKQLEMIKADEKAAYIYISSAFAANYYNLIRYDKLIEYQTQLIELQKQVINSYKIKYEFGTATVSEIKLAEKDMTFMQEYLQKLLEKQDILKNQLSILISDNNFENINRIKFDDINFTITPPKNIPFQVLDNRPDRIKSELDLERIGIDVKIAKRELLPKFIINGNLGFNMYSLSSSNKFLADIGIMPTWDLFMGGRKIQMLKLQKDKYDIAVQHYEKTILTAIQESNDALYSIKTAEHIKHITNNRINTDKKELIHTKIREEAGTADCLDILSQEQKLIQSKMQNVSAKTNEIIAAINLFQALGGVDFTEIEVL